MSKPTATWDRIGDKYYRRVQLYNDVFDEDLDFENYIVVGAPYGGAVAFYRDESKLHTFRASQATSSSIDIYSCAGKLIRRINWDHGSIKAVGWSDDEKLLVVTDDGTVRCWHNLQGDFTPFSLGHGAEDFGVKDCRFWSHGCVALLNNNHLVAVDRYDEPRPKLLANPPPETVTSWSLISPAQALSRSVEVLLAVGSTIWVVDASEARDYPLSNGPFKQTVVSPNGKFIGLYTDDSKLWVVSSDFSNRLTEYDPKIKTSPRDVQWCGNSSVVIAWDDEVHMVGPNGAAAKYFYNGFVHLLPDIDGLRILASDVCEFLQRVPDVTEDIFRPGSNDPAAILLEAADHLEQKSPKADELIQLIRSSLPEAVDTCVKAAGHEFAIHWQKQLLKAASFGKSVLDLYNSDDFVDMCESLRVLNAVRFYEVGLPISYEQYNRLTPEKMIERLINRHEYLLALKMSEYLHLSTERIYVHWASQKVRVSSDDEDSICRLIVQKLSGKRGVSFESIAHAAYDEGRARLATELLNYEPRAGKQVPLLLNMKEDTIALDKAIESGDTDLVYYVLLHLKKKLPLASFFRTINTRPMASALVESSALDRDRDLLKDLYYQDDRRLDGSNLLVAEALQQSEPEHQSVKLRSAAKLLQDSKEYSYQVKAIEETQKLLRQQEAFERDLQQPGSFVGLSINETVYKLIRTGNVKRAQKIVSEFKVPEKTFWWLRLRALVAARHWNELEEVGKIKKSPIGWEPFFNEVLSAGNTRLASVFIPKCTALPPSERTEMWVKCGLIVKAGEEALKAKDMNSLAELRMKATGNAAIEIERMIKQLSPQKR